MSTKQVSRRRSASQSRSKQTVERILDSAAALISEREGDFTMTAVAQRANVVIGSLYQYFADKSAIYRALLVRHHEEVRAMLHTYVTGVKSLEELKTAIAAAASHYFDLHQSDPLYNNLWSAVQVDAELQAIDLKDTLKNAHFLLALCRPLVPASTDARLLATCALLLQFALTTARFARVLPKQLQRQTLLLFLDMMRHQFDLLAQPGARAVAFAKRRGAAGARVGQN